MHVHTIFRCCVSLSQPLSKTTELPTAHHGGDKVKNVDLSVLNRLKQEMQKLADEAKVIKMT